MTIRKNITKLAFAAATAITVAGVSSPAMANQGRDRAFVGGMLLGSILTQNNGYYAPQPRYYSPPPRVVVRREYYYGRPDWRWRYHHRHHWHHRWDDRWDD